MSLPLTRLTGVTDRALAAMFDGQAEAYDEDTFHPAVAAALVDSLTGEPGTIVDVACGTGAAAFAVLRHAPRRVLAVDFSAAMIAKATAKAVALDPDGRIEFTVGSAVPLPVAAGGVDAVVCASALHFLGAAAVRDWLRVLRPGGQVAFSISDAARFTPSPDFVALLGDLVIPDTEDKAAALATDRGFGTATARRFTVTAPDRTRSVFLVHATAVGAAR